MGIHLVLVKTKEIVSELDWSNNPIDYLEYDRVKEWDTCRYVGDKQFNSVVDKVWNEEDSDLWRPQNFEQAKHWIRNNVPGPERLLLAMEMMEQDPKIYFKTSY